MLILANISPEDAPHQGHLKYTCDQYGIQSRATTRTAEMGQLLASAKRIGAEAIFVTHPGTLKNIVNDPKPSLGDWRGSVLHTSIPIVISNPLDHINTVPEGRLLHHIDVSKLRRLQASDRFLYNLLVCHEPEHLEEARDILAKAAILVVDIETNFHNQIYSISFTPITNSWTLTKSYVIPLDPKYYQSTEATILAWEVTKQLCESPMPKVFHNGTFDCFHLLRYHIVPENYIYDTEYIWRCWHAELPKALAKIASYTLPDFYYWKHESETSPLEYNGKDTINTARIFLYQLRYAPEWVWINYRQLYPNIAPVLYTAFEGMLTDPVKLVEAKGKAQADLDQSLEELRSAIALPNFNPGSPQQVSILLYGILRARKPGRAKSKSATDETSLKAVARQHPLYSWIVDKIFTYRENKKAISTYYDAPLTHDNRLLYSFNLDGTETARMSCNSSSLRTLKEGKRTYVKSNMTNYGTQLQNIPPYHKKALRADPGYTLINIDKSQSEARCVAYISPCSILMAAIEDPPEVAGVKDFYCYTGYKFFGIEFDKSHPLRQAVKRIIHGTNYLMGAQTFIDAVGVEELNQYRQLLGYRGTLLSFAKYLLSLYHKTYPGVKKGWKKVEQEVRLTHKVVTPDGWTRVVEGDIDRFQNILRAIVAHRSQHWSVWGINRAFWSLFYQLQVPSNGAFRLKGQIHDSIVAQIVGGMEEEYTNKMLEIMQIPQPCEAGILNIPLDVETGVYWKE